MTRRIAVLSAVPLLLLAGCTSSSSASSEAAPASSPAGSGGATPSVSSGPPLVAPAADRRLDDAEAKAALITTADLPDGWDAVDQDVVEATLSNRVLKGTADPESCQPLVDAVDVRDTTTVAAAAFRRSLVGPYLAQTVASYEQPVAPRLAALLEAVRACPSFTVTDGGGDPVALTVTPLPAPAGPDSGAFRVSGTRGVVPSVADVMIAARGRTVVGVLGGGVQAPAGTIVTDALLDAVAKLPVR